MSYLVNKNLGSSGIINALSILKCLAAHSKQVTMEIIEVKNILEPLKHSKNSNIKNLATELLETISLQKQLESIQQQLELLSNKKAKPEVIIKTVQTLRTQSLSESELSLFIDALVPLVTNTDNNVKFSAVCALANLFPEKAGEIIQRDIISDMITVLKESNDQQKEEANIAIKTMLESGKKNVIKKMRSALDVDGAQQTSKKKSKSKSSKRQENASEATENDISSMSAISENRLTSAGYYEELCKIVAKIKIDNLSHEKNPIVILKTKDEYSQKSRSTFFYYPNSSIATEKPAPQTEEKKDERAQFAKR